MNDNQNDNSEGKSATPNTLTDSDIKTTKISGRRLFLGALGVTALGATAIVLGHSSTAAKAADSDSNDSKKHHDFPKASSKDSDTTRNKDLKAVDSDTRNSKAVDSDQNRLRDSKGSADSD